MTKKTGFMGGLEKLGLVEADPTAFVEGGDRSIEQPRPIQPPPVFQATPTTAVLSKEDQDRLKALEAQVYATPSSYVIFQRVKDKLGSGATIQSVFDVLSVANPGVTPQKVLADIDGHLGIIASKRAEFDSQIAQAKAKRVDGAAGTISELTAENAKAQQEINDRTAQITSLQSSIQDAAKSIQDGQARFKLVEDQLSYPLLQAKQLLSSIS